MSEIKYVTPSGLAHYDEKIKEVIDEVDTSTNTKVTQTPTSTDASYPLLLSPSGQTQETNTTSYFNSGVVLNPSTKTISADIDGNAKTATKATSADSATKATQDGDGNVITETYAEKETIALKSATGTNISVTDSKEAPMILNYAPVNLFSHSFETTTKSGITFTANADGTITANGTATGNIEITVGTHTFTENDVGKKFSWSDNGITKVADINWDAHIFMNYINGASSWRASYCFTVETAHTVNIKIYVLKGEVLENKVFRPMLEEGSTYHTYVPYTGYDITASNDEASKSTSVTINSETVFPVNGLESYDGLTNVLNPYSATMEVTYATNEAGQGILKEIETKAEINGSNATGDWNINITGNAKTATKATSADSATKATQDGDGKNIASTYLKAGIWKTHYYDGLNGGKLLILLEDVTEWYKGTTQKYVDLVTIISIERAHWYGNPNARMAICQAGIGYYGNKSGPYLHTTDSNIRPVIVSKTENDTTTYYLALLSSYGYSSGQFINMLYSYYVNGVIKTPLLTKITFDASLVVPDGYSIVRDNKSLFIEAAKATSADSATKATQDGDGNVITDTYAKKSIYGDTAVSMGRKADTTAGTNSFAFGNDVTASGDYSHAEGSQTTASGNSSHAEGYHSTASGQHSHAEGWGVTASGQHSHAEGGFAEASNNYSHAEGYHTTASGNSSHAEGEYTTASSYYSHAEGYYTTALMNQHAQGHYNNTTTATANSTSGTSDGTAFVIGNGTSDSKSNAFRVTGKGVIYATNATVQTGADYAEYFEWSDGNPDKEDRVGYFVTFDEDNPEKIRIANEDDYILGIVSGMPNIIGNGDECWKQRYILDDFGRYIEETFEYEVEVPEVAEKEVEDEETGETKIVEEVVIHKETKIGTKWKENPEYDPTQPYIPRDKRAEWSAIGMLGVLSVRDDGTCQVNGYCKCTDGGIATACEKDEGVYRVIKRVTDNIVKVVLK